MITWAEDRPGFWSYLLRFPTVWMVKVEFRIGWRYDQFESGEGLKFGLRWAEERKGFGLWEKE
jgi:hypothetical protein